MRYIGIIIILLALSLIPLVYWTQYAEPNETPIKYTTSIIKEKLNLGFSEFEHLNYSKETPAVRSGENIVPEPKKTVELVPPVTTDTTTEFTPIT